MSASVAHTSAPAHHHYTTLGLDSRKIAIWAFIGSECIVGSARVCLGLTGIAGRTSLGFQAFDFTSLVQEGLPTRTTLFGSSFFTLTGFHGAHVTAGVIWLVTLLAIDYRRGLGSRDSLLVDIAALYWHFVDVIWIVIFTLVYLIK